MPDAQKKSSHLGAGLLVGSMIGVAAGLFLQSKEGKNMVRDAKKRSKVMESKILKELKTTKKLTKAKYADMVDGLTDYYVKSKDITKKQVPEIRRYLLSKWKEIEKELKKTAK